MTGNERERERNTRGTGTDETLPPERLRERLSTLERQLEYQRKVIRRQSERLQQRRADGEGNRRPTDDERDADISRDTRADGEGGVRTDRDGDDYAPLRTGTDDGRGGGTDDAADGRLHVDDVSPDRFRPAVEADEPSVEGEEVAEGGDERAEEDGDNADDESTTDGEPVVDQRRDLFAGDNAVEGHPDNTADGTVGSVVSGGGTEVNPNEVHGDYGTVGGGENNQAGHQRLHASHATVGGGCYNTASGWYATVSGGDNNTADEDYATVGGGTGNAATGRNAVVPGGEGNTASGDASLAAGQEADTNGCDGAFVWGDSTGDPVTATRDDEVRFQAAGGLVVEGTDRVEIEAGLPAGTGTRVGVDASGRLVDTGASRPEDAAAVEPLSTDTAKILDLDPRTFEYEGGTTVGFAAADVAATAPELVSHDDDGQPAGVAYDRLPAYLVPEVSDNRERLADVEADAAATAERVAELETENERLRERLDDIESRLDNAPAE